ncbi:MAG: riboflavin synthase [Alphaproteobacteria bacterium]|nr:riboflavin synthase [Alphaproteobacteria bacterium]
MFTGIVKDVGQVKAVDEGRGDLRFTIQTALDLSQIKIGASVSCDGCCLTVVDIGDDWFSVDASKETLNKTILDEWTTCSRINLEPSLTMGEELGGHLVSGHVYGVLTIKAIKREGDSHRIVFDIPEGFEHLIAPKGSIALNGISLTVNDVTDADFGVNIIPHTWMNTNMSSLQVGDEMNFEIDMLARYVARIMGKI